MPDLGNCGVFQFIDNLTKINTGSFRCYFSHPLNVRGSLRSNFCQHINDRVKIMELNPKVFGAKPLVFWSYKRPTELSLPSPIYPRQASELFSPSPKCLSYGFRDKF